MTTNKITFKADTVERKRYFTAASFSHPAKMHLQLQIYLIENFTKKGDTILDPMGGSGTLLIACALSRNVVMVELEDKFVKMQQANLKKIQRLGPFLGHTLGRAAIIHGDARNLEEVWADNIICSPPYAEAQTGGGIAQKGYQGPKHSPTDLIGKRSYMPEQLGRSEGQIGNLPYGKISAILTSPPYANRVGDESDNKGHRHFPGDDNQKYMATYPPGKNNIGNLPYGEISAVISSPPYAETGVGDWKTGRDEFQKWVLNELATKGYVDWQGKRYTESEWRALNHGRIDGRTTKGVHKHPTNGYGKTNGQIGNLKSENYLQAMLQVYIQCHKVLKEKGLMVLVVKNFIRDKKIIRLDLDTIKLCKKAGFNLKERLARELTQQSFWRTIYHQKYPDVDKIEFEDVLIFEK